MSDRDKSDKSLSRRRRGLFGGPDDALMQGLTPMPQRKKKRRGPPSVPQLPNPELTGPLPGLEDSVDAVAEPTGEVLEVNSAIPPGFIPVTVPPEGHSGFTEPAYGLFEEEFDTLPAGGPVDRPDPEMDTEMAVPADEVYGFVDDGEEEIQEEATEGSSADFVPEPGRRVDNTGPKLQIRMPAPERRAEGLGTNYDQDGWESREGSEDNVSVFEEHSDDSLFNLVAGRNDEDFADPPSDVIEFGPLPRGRGVVVREDMVLERFSNEDGPRDEGDAEVWRDDPERALPSRRGSSPRAWWETGPAQSPLPEKKATWETPESAPDFRGATRDEKERAARRTTFLRVVAALVIFIAIGALAFSRFGGEAPKTTPTVEVTETTELATIDAAEPTVDAAEPEAPAVVDVEPPVPAVEPPAPEAVVAEPEAPSIAATAESEEAARQAIYETGLLVVHSEPRALIYIDGRRRGYTPIDGLHLAPGNHLVKAVVPGRAPKYSQVRVDPGGAHVVPFAF
ncbi:MAG TPA: PEGA domain-containing protein [Myxococcota bacterium]|nr:PEGA domain-containing protein [Myxococcota bacterium]